MNDAVRCPECRELRDLKEVPPAHAEHGGLHVEIFGLRLLRCATADHPAAAPHPDFVADLVSAATAGGAVPCATTRGLWRRRPVCGGCGGDLTVAQALGGSVRARVRIPHAAPLTVTVEGPCVECPGCHRVQLPGTPGSADALQRALLGALSDSGIPGAW